MGIGDWGLGIGDWAQSPIPNPQSPIPNPHFYKFVLINTNLINKKLLILKYIKKMKSQKKKSSEENKTGEKMIIKLKEETVNEIIKPIVNLIK